MKRRTFIHSIIGLTIAATGGLLSFCSRCKPKKVAEYHEYVDGTVDQPPLTPETCDISVSKKDENTNSDTVVSQKDINENRYYDPHWNVNGSWSSVENRHALISHLSGFNHNYKESYLKTLSTDELQKLHDDDHDSRSSRTRTWRWRR
jgi:hypothetical protein